MRHFNKPVALTAVLCLFAVPALGGPIPDRATLQSILGANGILEDFESFDIGPGGAVNLDVAVLDENTIANGQGPGLVEDGAVYIAALQFQWNGDAYFGLPTKTLLSNSSDGKLRIEYDTPMTAVGFDMLDFFGFSHDTTVSVFDSNNNLIDSLRFTVANAVPVFFGYEASDIKAVELVGTASWSAIINDHLYGVSGFTGTLDCPIRGGTATLTLSGGTPNGGVGIVASTNGSGFTVPIGPCAGTIIATRPPFLPGFPVSTSFDANGDLSMSGNVPAGLCDVLSVSAVDTTTCDVVDLP